MSILVEHARVELTRIGEEPETIEGYLKVIQAFVDMDHSGGSASVAIPVIIQLLQFKPLGKISDDPDEWIFHNKHTHGASEDLWQNKRNPAAFSSNAGRTYWLVDEVEHRAFGKSKRKFYTSEKSG